MSAVAVPVFYFNGTPSTRLEALLVHEAASKLGIPVVGVDRPGFGHSSFQENRTLLDWPKDILALADELNIRRFAVLGLSGGGPHALACLHQISSERLIAATTVSGMWPVKFGVTGMMLPTRLFFKIAAWSPWTAELLFEAFMGRASRVSDRQAMKEKTLAHLESIPQPQIDKDCLREILNDDVLCEAMIDGPQEALRISSRGAAREMHIIGTDWGFDVTDIDGRRLTVWHGALDVNVPIGMARRASVLMPEVKLKALEGHGHISLILRHREDILEELLSRIQGRDIVDQ
jgi:pimeloyl-ACP methyl ester carboxylesterase